MIIDNPDTNTKKDIELVIKNTRMNNLEWSSLNHNKLAVKNPNALLGEMTNLGDIILKQWSTCGFEETGIRYSLKIGDKEVTSKYNPVNVFGKYLFCEDYEK